MYINCDMAESYGNFKIGDDQNIIPYVDACNIACGFHGGDPLTIWNTIKMAISAQKLIGAHPSYPDLVGFGRRHIQMTNDELYTSLIYQIGAIKSITETQQGKLHHVKPHGALYNYATVDVNSAHIIAQAIHDIDIDLIVLAPAASELEKAALEKGLEVHIEVFADRRYDAMGRLAPRTHKHAVIKDADDIYQHYQNLLQGFALTIDGNLIPIKGQTVCLHGDHPFVIDALKLIKKEHFG